MLATLTSKGQVTLRKEIRDRLGLDAGAVLDFQVGDDGTITARRITPDARRGCDFTATFDRGMRNLPGVKVL